jgi:hypothetical protein
MEWVNPSAFYGGLSLWALSGAESTSMTRRIHAFRGAFRGTVFNPNGRPVVSLFRQAWLKKCGCCFKAVHYRKKNCDGLIGAFITTHTPSVQQIQ